MGSRIKKGDKVIVLTGRDSGKSGKVLKAFPNKGRMIVEGVNLVKRHIRRRSESETGGVKQVPASLNISNVALFCPNCSRGVRVAVKLSKDKSKIRICKRCKRAI